MTSIRDAVRITRKGESYDAQAVYSLARLHGGTRRQALTTIQHHTHVCNGPTCPNEVGKAGSSCSLECLKASQEATAHAALIERLPVEQVEHVTPCGVATCLNLECLVLATVRQHLLENVSEQDRPHALMVAELRLDRLMNDSQHGTEGPDFFITECIDAVQEWHPEWPRVQPRVQIEKPVLEAPAKVTRKPQVAKHQPRITDGQQHPVVVTTVPRPTRPILTRTTKETTVPTYTQADLDRAIRQAIEDRAHERVAEILAAKATQAPAEDRTFTTVGNNGPNMVVSRGDGTREGDGVVLPGFMVDNSLTIEPLSLGDLTLDAVVSSATRSLYNKAQFRLAGEPPLPKEVTYRALVNVHATLAGRAQAKAGEKVSDTTKATAVAQAPATNKTHVWKGKAVTAKQYAHYTRGQVQVAVTTPADQPAKVSRRVKIAALVEHLGVTKQQAKAILDA